MKAAKGCLTIIGGLVVLGVVIAIFSVGKSVDKSQQSADNVKANYGAITMGMRKSEVISILGTPEDAQHFENSFMGTTDTSDCIYYGSLAETSYQFCFTNGRLDSKNQY